MKKNLLSTVAFLVCASVSMGQTVPFYVPKSGLVGWWPFTGNAMDSSGNGNHGTVSGSTLTTDRFGNVNSAYDFNNSYIHVASSSTLNCTQGSINFWLNTTNTGLMVPIKKNDYLGAVNEQYTFAINYSDLFSIKYGSSCIPGSGWFTSGGNNSILINGNWHMVTATFSNEVKIYIDGVLISNVTAPSSNSDNCPGDLQFGRGYNAALDYYIGKLDDIGIWNRPLTQQEIKNLYNSNTLGITPNQLGNVSIVPNPVLNKLNINAPCSINKLVLFNLIGQVVYTANPESNTASIDMSQYPTGIYILKVNDVWVEKIIKE